MRFRYIVTEEGTSDEKYLEVGKRTSENLKRKWLFQSFIKLYDQIL